MGMVHVRYDVDEGYEFEEDENGDPVLPKGVKWEGNLCVLPNGRYPPPGFYATADGCGLIYEPKELSWYADLLA